jgi:uncharacterized membrane protein YkoI
MKRALACLFALLVLGGSPALARDHDEEEEHGHDRARARVLSGEILPLSTIVGRAELSFGAEMIEAELESRHGRPVYELKLLSPGGRLMKVYYDAVDGSLLKSREER